MEVAARAVALKQDQGAQESSSSPVGQTVITTSLSAPIRKYGDIFLSREARQGRHSLAHGDKPWVGAGPVERSPARGRGNTLCRP
jgi:hypothetical protein